MSYKNEIFLESLFCIESACKNLGLKYEFFGENNSCLQVFGSNGKILFFYQNQNPFNSSITFTICKDKRITLDYFLRYGIPTPDSIALINPGYSEETYAAAEFKDVETFYKFAEDKWGTPFIMKKAVSSLAQHVYLITNFDEAKAIWDQYFFPNSKRNTFIAQEYVEGREFRVVALKGKTLLAYEKISDVSLLERSSHHDLNPLHSGYPSKITDTQTLEMFSQVTESIYKNMQIDFTGIDIIIDKNNNLKVLEINANPACFFYNGHYGREDFTKVYQECLTEYLR